MYESPMITEVGSVRDLTLGKQFAPKFDDSTWTWGSILIASF